MVSAESPSVGLRERKKARTRAAIQYQALRLFLEQGYEATTVQQIIATVEVSESTFFRYFPTKADVVMLDEFDPVIVSAFRAQPPELSVLGALRAAFHSAFGQLSDEETSAQRDRMIIVLEVPELRAAMLDQLASAMSLLVDLVAERTGRPSADIAVVTLAGAVVGAAMAALFAIRDDPSADLAAKLDETIGALESGLHL